jgi:TP901 family phage tail tape measure protein
MAEDANARIRVDIDTAAALANIKNLQRQISAFHTSLAKSGAAANASSLQMQQSLINSINKTGQFSATLKNVKTTTDSFTNSLEKNKLSMGEYFRYSGASTKTFGRFFRTEFDTINKVARERVKDLQTQYIKMGRDANGAMRAIAVRPLVLDMENLSTRTQIAAQRQALLNQLLKQGSTNLLNFGKNTQWAGRQLMVGFTIPLVMFGSVASKTFMEVEKQAVRFKRVYGELFTTGEQTEKALEDIKQLGNEFTKYGIAVSKTMELAADIAAMGKMGAELNAQVAETTRLAVLGGVEQEEALKATISLTDAFGVSADELAGKIDFLNAVENQTVTSIEDLTIAIPKAGPVVKQLGGDVEDLTFFLTAMREGGINASEGANALKSGLASLINPTRQASEMLRGFGINITGIVEANAGDVKGLVLDFATALDTLDPLNRARAIEQLFGKFQFSRLSTLFQNVIKEGNQASRVLQLTNATTEELAVLSARELKRVEDSPMFKFQKALEDIKVTLVPLGEAFLKAVTPILEFGTKILKKFDELDDGAKNFVVGLTAIAGVIGPVFLMGFGLIANGVANVIKGFVFFKTAMNKAATSSTNLGMQTEYMTQQQLEASAVAASLDQVHQKLRQTFTSEAIAVNGLTEAYRRAIAAQVAMTGGVITRTRPPKGAGPAIGYASGVLSVPGPKGAGDVVPAMLSPGEAVIPARQAQKYSGFISSMIADNVPGFRFGRNPFASMLGRSQVAVRMKDQDFISELRQSGKNARYKSAFETGTGADYLNRSGSVNEKQKIARASFERDLFGLDPKTALASERPTYGYARTPILSSIVNRIFGGKGKRFNAVTTGTREKSGMGRYGNIDLITKNSVAKRSTVYPGDSFMSYVRARDSEGTRRSGPNWAGLPYSPIKMDFPAMRGASKKDQGLFNYRFGNPFGTIKTGERTYSSNLEPPYIETQTPGGFAFREIDKIIARDRATAAALRKELRAAGLGSVRVTGSNFVTRLFKQLGVPGYKDGIFSVPGPKGAGDVVPSMLAPGEAVIPARQSTKYQDLIKGIIAENIPGYQQSVPSGIPVPLTGEDRMVSFPDSMNVNSGHMASGARNITLSQAIRLAHREWRKGVRTGTFDRLGIDSKQLWRDYITQIRKIRDAGVSSIHQYPNLLETITKQSNVATATIGASGLTAQQHADEIRRLPRGAFGAGILARLPQNHGIPDSELRKYIGNIERSYLSQLQAAEANSPGRKLTEAETNKFYDRATRSSVFQIADPKIRRVIKDSNFANALQMTPAIPGGASSSGRTTKWLDSFGGNLQKKTRDIFYGRDKTNFMQRLFGDDFARTRNRGFLDQVGVMVPGSLKDQADAIMKSETLTNDQKARVANQLIDAKNENKATTKRADRFSNYARILRESPEAQLARGLDRASNAKSPSKKLVDASAKNMVDGTIKGIEDGKPAATKAGQAFGTAFIDGTERVRVTEKGQFYDRNTNKRISAADAKRTMALDRQNERSRERAAARRELRDRRGAGVTQSYGIDQKQYDAMSEEQRKALRHERKLNKSKARAIVVENAKVRDAEKQRVADAKVAAEQKQQRTAARKERFSAMGGKVAGGASMVGMGAMMYGMTGGPGADIAMMAAMPLMMATMAGKLAPVLIGLTGIAVAAFALKNAFDQAQTSTMKLAESLGTGDSAVEDFAEFAGKASAGEIMDKRRENALQPFAIQMGKSTFGQSFIESEQGQGMAAATRESISKLGRSGTETQLVTQLVNAVSSGALDAGQARSIVSNIAKEIGDASFGLNVNAKLVELLGVNGENLLEDPLTIRIKLAEDSEKQIGVVAGKMQELANPFQVLGEAALSTGILAGSAALVGGPWGAVAGTVAGLVNGVPQVINAFANMGTASAAVVANSKMALQQQQQLLDSLDLDYEKRIAIAEAAGDLEKAERLTNRYMEDRAALLEQGKETRAAIADSFNSTDSAGKMALQEAAKKSIENRFKDDADGLALAMGARQQVIDASGLDDTQEYMLTVGLASDLDPLVISELMNQFGSNKEVLTKTLNLMDNLGNADTNRTLNVMKMFRDENGEPLLDQQTKFVANISAKSDVPEEARKYLEMFESVSRVLDAEIVLTYLNEHPEAADKMLEMKEIIDSVDGKMGMDVVTDLVGEENMDNFKEYEQYFNGLPDNFQKTFMTQFVTTMLLQGNEAMMDQYEAWLNEPGNRGKEFTDFALGSGYITTETQKDNTVDPISDEDPGGGSGGPAASSLDDILKKLRDIRKNQIGVTKGFEASAAAINKLFGGGSGINLFSGIENDMRRLGAEEDLISLIAGMDPEEFEKQKNTLFNFDKQSGEIIGFKEQLQNVGRALAAVALGQYVSDQQRSAKESRNQVLAFNQLRAAGFSVAEAYEAVEDAAVASAVATGNVTRDQLNTMLAELRNARAAMEEAARLTPEGLQDVFEEGFNRAMETFDVRERKLTLEYELQIADDEKIIKDAQDQIDAIRYQLDDYEADLRGIEDQENAINETYDKKVEALEKVRKANQQVLDQEKGKLSVAEAITRGDLAATARAIQDVRQSSASSYFTSQTDALNAGRQSALDSARSRNGLSRIEVEERIEQLTNQIFEIEESALEPAAERVRLADLELEARLEEERVLGRTKKEWENIKNGIDLARVSSAGYKDDMDKALAVVQDVKDAWAGIQSKTVTLTTIQQTVPEGTPTPSNLNDGPGKNDGPTAEEIAKAEEAAARAAAITAAQEHPMAWMNQTNQIKDRARIMNSALPAVYASDGIAKLLSNYIGFKNQTLGATSGSAYQTAAASAKSAYEALHNKLKSRGFNSGGYISGPGTPTSDSIPAMLSDGEYVIRASSVDKFGTGFLDSVNDGQLPGYRLGGLIRDGGGSKRSSIPAKTKAQIEAEERRRQSILETERRRDAARSAANSVQANTVGRISADAAERRAREQAAQTAALQARAEAEAQTQRDALYRQGGAQGFEAGLGSTMAAFAKSDVGKFLGDAYSGEGLGNQIFRGALAILSTPAEIVGSFAKNAMDFAAKPNINSLIKLNPLLAINEGTRNAFSGVADASKQRASMFEQAGQSVIDNKMFGAGNAESDALARVIAGSLNIFGDPTTYLGIGAAKAGIKAGARATGLRPAPMGRGTEKIEGPTPLANPNASLIKSMLLGKNVHGSGANARGPLPQFTFDPFRVNEDNFFGASFFSTTGESVANQFGQHMYDVKMPLREAAGLKILDLYPGAKTIEQQFPGLSNKIPDLNRYERLNTADLKELRKTRIGTKPIDQYLNDGGARYLHLAEERSWLAEKLHEYGIDAIRHQSGHDPNSFYKTRSEVFAFLTPENVTATLRKPKPPKKPKPNLMDNEYRIANIKEELVKALKNPAIVTRRSVNSVEAMLRDNKPKTLFDTGTSGGLADKGSRAQYEAANFGPESVGNILYGYLANKQKLTTRLPLFPKKDTVDSFGPFSWATAPYGDTLIELKKSFLEKVSLTAGDSLENFYGANPLKSGVRDAGFITRNLKDASQKDLQNFAKTYKAGDDAYIEAQFSKFDPRLDIKTIWTATNDARTAQLRATVKELGLDIPVKVAVFGQTGSVLGNAVSKVKGIGYDVRDRFNRLKRNNFDLSRYNPFTNSYSDDLEVGGLAEGGLVKPKFFANGGFVSKGTDTVPAMLSPGEYVVKSQRVKELGTSLFDNINSGSFSAGSFSGGPSVQSFSSPSFNTQVSPVSISQGSVTSSQVTPVSSSSVYNYNLSVNVASQSDPNAIAQTVMGQIRNIDSQRIRSTRF